MTPCAGIAWRSCHGQVVVPPCILVRSLLREVAQSRAAKTAHGLVQAGASQAAVPWLYQLLQVLHNSGTA
jgi:hypothetical protein